MKWGLWSTTAAANSAAPPDGWPEGQAPSTVNDCAREMMAAIATGLQDIQFVDLGWAPTQVSGTRFTVSGTHADVLHYGRRLKMYDGAATLYGTVISATATANTAVEMRFDTGTAPLDSSLSSFAVGSPGQFNGALPEQVWREKDYLDNSQFDVWQRGVGPFQYSSGSTQNTKPNADRWIMGWGTGSAGPSGQVIMLQRSAAASNVPTLAQCGVLLNASLLFSTVTPVGGLSGIDSFYLGQRIEGYNFRQIAQKPMTLSFWVNSTITGTYSIHMQNSNASQGIVLPYSISAPGVWEKKTINIPPSPAAGAWDYSFGIGLTVQWVLAAGATVATASPGGAWSSSSGFATVGHANVLAQVANFALAGCKLQEGDQATALVPTDYRDELMRCQRYLVPISGTLFGNSISTNNSLYAINAGANYRAASVSATLMVALAAISAVNGGNVGTSISAVAGFAVDRNGYINVTAVGAPFTVGQGTRIGLSVGGTLTWIFFKSEL